MLYTATQKKLDATSALHPAAQHGYSKAEESEQLYKELFPAFKSAIQEVGLETCRHMSILVKNSANLPCDYSARHSD